MNDNLVIYADGGARGNPGPAAIGVVIKRQNGAVVRSFGRFIGQATNNQAEYQALIAALEEAKIIGARKLICFLDSELLVKQIRREYRVKNKQLQTLFVKVWNLTVDFEDVSFNHVPRRQNKEADKLVNAALDQQMTN